MHNITTDEDLSNAVPARHWHREDGRIVCDLCPRACKLQEGQRGLCFVRARVNDQLVLTTYGRSSGFCIDPIEKKPLSHFLPGTPVLSFGTAGCNLTCKFCQNWDISKSRQMDRLMDTATPKAIAQAAKQTGCRSVAYTYNDPVIFLEYAVDIAKACHDLDIKNVAVTAGYINEGAREEFFDRMDAVNLDIKAFSKDFYKQLCTADIENVKETAIYLAKKPHCWLEVTTLLIPDENDSDEEIKEFSHWFYNQLGPDIPLHFTAFHPDYKMRDKARTPKETLLRARALAKDAGIHHVYCGNVHDKHSATTYCPSCHKALIERDWHQILSWRMAQGGHCADCGTAIAGIFEGKAGNWGQKRQRVSFKANPPAKPTHQIKKQKSVKINLPSQF